MIDGNSTVFRTTVLWVVLVVVLLPLSAFGGEPPAYIELLRLPRKIVKAPVQKVVWKKQYDVKCDGGAFGRATISLDRARTLTGELFGVNIRFSNGGPGRRFYNPFFINWNEYPARLAVFDSKKRYVGDIRKWQPKRLHMAIDRSDWVWIPRGKYVGGRLLYRATQSDGVTDFKPGTYFLQMIYYRVFTSDPPTKNERVLGMPEAVRPWKWESDSDHPAQNLRVLGMLEAVRPRKWEFDYGELFRSNILKIEFVKPQAPQLTKSRGGPRKTSFDEPRRPTPNTKPPPAASQFRPTSAGKPSPSALSATERPRRAKPSMSRSTHGKAKRSADFSGLPGDSLSSTTNPFAAHGRKILKSPEQNVVLKARYDLKARDAVAGRAAISTHGTKAEVGKSLAVRIAFSNKGRELQLYNPFFRWMLQDPARLALFDSRKKYVGDLPAFLGRHARRMCDPSDWVSVPGGGNVGRTVHFLARQPGHIESLKPGTYYLQMIYYRAFISRPPTEKVRIAGKPEWLFAWKWEFDYAELFRSNIVKIEFVKPKAPQLTKSHSGPPKTSFDEPRRPTPNTKPSPATSQFEPSSAVRPSTSARSATERPRRSKPSTPRSTREPVKHLTPLKQPNASEKRPLEMGISVTYSKSVTKPSVLVTYFNSGSKTVELWLPRQTIRLPGTDKQIQLRTFRQVAIRIDGQAPQFIYKVHSLLNPVFSRRVKLKSGDRAHLQLPLGVICKVPKDWETITLKATGVSGVDAKVVGNLTMRHVRHTFLDPIHVTAAPVLPVNFADPKIAVRFQNIGKKTFHLPLPKAGTETKMFWSVSAKIDRKKVRSFGDQSPDGGYKPWTRFVPLEAGESTEITIRLKDYFKFPKDWKLIEIAASEFSLPKKGRNAKFMNPEFQDTLTLTRPLKRPINVPPEVWDQSNDRVRWFLYHQQEQLEKLKAKPAQKQ